MTEPVTKLSCEMSIVTKAAGVGGLAQRLVRSGRRPFLVEKLVIGLSSSGERSRSLKLAKYGSIAARGNVPDSFTLPHRDGGRKDAIGIEAALKDSEPEPQ